MLIDCVIPTKWRKNKLDECLNSLFKAIKDDTIHIYVYFSVPEEKDYYIGMMSQIKNVHLIVLDKEYNVPDFWNSHLRNMTADILFYLNDDVIVFEDTLDKIKLEFIRYFPDYDGIIGLNQLNLNDFKTVEGAFGAIGRKYADRFPDRNVFCPNYRRLWADFELWQFAKSINKFHFSTEAQLIHKHPCTDRRLEDATHKDVRKYLRQDREIFEKRKAMGLLWGKSWDLLNYTA